MKTNLYAYFGFLGAYQTDSPGHTFYQLGLLDSIKEEFGGDKFDFYSYYPNHIKEKHIVFIPDNPIGNIFENKFNELMNTYNIGLEETISRIKSKEYNKIFLKARFRNLSTLAKKWDDTLQFETILNTAIEWYPKENIVILDTDLSLPESFIEKYKGQVTILIPSIDFPGISESFLDQCVKVNLERFESKERGIVFYGNIDTSNYKASNSKGEILKEALSDLATCEYAENFNLTVVGKEGTDLQSILDIGKSDKVIMLPRHERVDVWTALSINLLMLNISKDKYADSGFIPARIYEAMIFGMIPVSYRFSFLNKAFSFSNLIELSEIIKYLDEVSPKDWAIAYKSFITSYKNHQNSLNEKRKNNTSMS